MEESFPAMLDTFMLVENTVQACIDGGVALSNDARFSAILLWYSLHGLVTLRQSITTFPWPDIDEAIDQILRRTIGFTD